MTCISKELRFGCFIPNNGDTPITIAIHFLYDKNGAFTAFAYTAPGSTVPINPDTYMGGGTVSFDECQKCCPKLIKCCDEDGNESIVAVDPLTGKTLWKKTEEEICTVDDQPTLWLLIAKSELSDLTTAFPGIVQVADLLTGSTHPSGPNAGITVNGWNAYAICSTTQPVDEPNGSYWITGSVNDYPSLNTTILNPDPTC